MSTAELSERAALGFEELLKELRRKHWTLIRWGPQREPELLAAMYRHHACADVIVLWGEYQATGYRVPTMDGSGVFSPDHVSYQYHASPSWTLRAILGLPEPGQPGAPVTVEAAASACKLPEELPKPVIIRPLGQ